MVTEHPKSVWVDFYGSVAFQCRAKQYGIIQVQWKKVGSSRLPKSSNTFITITKDGVNSTLKIDQIIHRYKGYYYCVVKNEIGEVNSSIAQLHVNGKFVYKKTKLISVLCLFNVVPCPEILKAPVGTTIVPGEVAKFDCLAYSHSTLQYTWKKKNSTSVLYTSKAIQDNTVAYSINNTQPSDEGWYCCVATNECGDVEECAWLEMDSELYGHCYKSY